MGYLLSNLVAPLSREMGDPDYEYYTSTQIQNALSDSIGDFNEETVTDQYSASGSGTAEELSTTPGTTDKRLIVLFAALVLVRGEIAKAARNAIIHSNPAGRTDLSKMVDSLEAQAERIEEKIERVRLTRGQTEVEKEASSEDWGVELKGRPSEAAEAIGILNIETTEN